MDPLTITLAVITITTAIKDIVELGQKIRDSVSQVARNDEEAQSLSEEMVETIHQLEIFCKDYHDILETSPHMKTALVKLTREMQAAYTKITTMLPQSTGKTFRHMKTKMKAWMRRNQVRDEIRELRDRISRCYLQFTTFTVMRIEGHLKRVNSVQAVRSRRTSMMLCGHTQRPSVSFEQGTIQLQVSDQRLAAFVGSASAAHPDSSLKLTENLLSDMYLHYQVGRVDKLLADFSAIQFLGTEKDSPSHRYTRDFQVSGSLGMWRSKGAIHDTAVRKTLEIQRILQKGYTLLTVEEAIWELQRLSHGLHHLDMNDDSVMTCQWIVHLFRSLVNRNPKVYMPYLVEALLDLSKPYFKTKDQENISIALLESQRLIQTLLTPGSTDKELTILHCRILITLGRLAVAKKDIPGALLLFEEAVGRFEMLLRPYFNITNAACKPLDTSWKQQRKYLALCDYAFSLYCLSSTLQESSHPIDSVFPVKKALAVVRRLLANYPESSIQRWLAELLFQLSNPVLQQVVSTQDALQYSKACATLYRKLYKRDPEAFDVRFYDALRRLGNILQQMGRRDDALLVRQETTDLARRITHNQILLAEALVVLSGNLHLVQRYDEALTWWQESNRKFRSFYKASSAEEARGHHTIAMALKHAGRLQEAVSEAEEAVAQYRDLAFNKPNQFRSNLAFSLWSLSDILNDAGDYPRAFNEGHESLKHYESLISSSIPSQPDTIKLYVYSLSTNLRIAGNLHHPIKLVERGEDVIRQFRQLAVRHPTQVDLKLLAEAMNTYSTLLDDLGMVVESVNWCKQALELHEGHASTSADDFIGHLNCLSNHAGYLWNQGYFSRALEPLGKAIQILERELSNHPNMASTLLNFKVRRAGILYNLDRCSEALEDIRPIAFALCCETTPSEDDLEVLNRFMMEFSRIYVLDMGLDDVTETVQESIELCGGRSVMNRVSRAILELENQVGDNWAEDDTEETVGDSKIIKGDPTHLPAEEKLLDDASILKSKRYYEERAEKRPGYAPKLAMVLWRLRIFYCAQGRHQEGEAAAIELKQLMLKIQAYPEPAGAAERILESKVNLPYWKTIFAELDLGCHHYQDR